MTLPVVAAMTGAELRTVREFLGLSTNWLAQYLEVGERKIMRWEAAEVPIPDGVAAQVDDLYEEAATIVSRLVGKYRALVKANDGNDVEILTYRTDEDYWAVIGDAKFPARWHRMLCARVAEQVPGLVVVYGSEAA